MTNTPPEVLEKWRKEFEDGKAPQTIQRGKRNQDRYLLGVVQCQWEGFLHRCKTAVIELPPHENAHNPYDGVQEYYQAQRLVKAIESQGYRVEVKGD